ncbi:MAG: response regulator [Candidatus Dormibacteria bacterium]
MPAAGRILYLAWNRSTPVSTLMYLAEDDPDIAAMNRQALESDDHHVEVARAGVEALEAVRRVEPDLLVLDMQMPRASGLEVVEELRAHSETAGQPVVMLSNAELTTEEEHRLQRLGVIDFLAKWKVGPTHLVRWIRQWAAQHRPHRGPRHGTDL